MEMTPEAAAKHAIDLLGGVRKTAAECGLTTQAVYQWKQVPADKVLRIEQATGISRHELRPDVFGEQA